MSRKRLDLTLDFLKRLDRTESVQSVRQVLLDWLSRYGCEHVMMGTIPMQGARPRLQLSHVLLVTLPQEWQQRYLRGGYLYRDPTVRCLPQARQPFSWEEASRRYMADAKSVRVMDEAAEFGLRHGVTVPLLTLDNNLAAASFSGRHVELGPDDLDMLQFVTTYAFAHLLLLQDRQAAAAVADLTAKQREVLLWAAEGKTITDIGDLLSLSTKCVEFHLSQIRIKLNTLNSAQSIAVALRQGLIT